MEISLLINKMRRKIKLQIRPFVIDEEFKIDIDQNSLVLSDYGRCKVCNSPFYILYFKGCVEDDTKFSLFDMAHIKFQYNQGTCFCKNPIELEKHDMLIQIYNEELFGSHKGKWQFLTYFIHDFIKNQKGLSTRICRLLKSGK
jgi:hypothetical protein